MKKTLLLLLFVAACMSCKKQIIEPTPRSEAQPQESQERHHPGVKKDTVPTPKSVDTTLTIVSDSVNTDHTVQGLKSSILQGVTIETLDVKMKGTSATLQTLSVHIAVGNNGTGGTNVSTLVNALLLCDPSGRIIGIEGIPPGANHVVFHNLNFPMAAGSTSRLTIRTNVSPIDGTIVAVGAHVQVNVTPDDIADVRAFDGSNKALNATKIFGSVTGPTIYFYVAGIVVTPNGSPTNTYSNPGGSMQHGIFTMAIPFSVTSFGTDSYIPSAAISPAEGTISNPTIINGPWSQCIVDNRTSLLMGDNISLVYAGSQGIYPDQHGNYKIPAGHTLNFVLSVSYIPTVAGSYQARLVNVNSNTTDSGTVYTSYPVNLNSNAFSTPYVTGQ